MPDNAGALRRARAAITGDCHSLVHEGLVLRADLERAALDPDVQPARNLRLRNRGAQQLTQIKKLDPDAKSKKSKNSSHFW